jgi:hypothetical protein
MRRAPPGLINTAVLTRWTRNPAFPLLNRFNGFPPLLSDHLMHSRKFQVPLLKKCSRTLRTGEGLEALSRAMVGKGKRSMCSSRVRPLETSHQDSQVKGSILRTDTN